MHTHTEADLTPHFFLLSLLRDDSDLRGITVAELMLHDITPRVTTTPPPGDDPLPKDSASVAMLIVWTLVVFVAGLVVATALTRCGLCAQKDPFTYNAPSESHFGNIAGGGFARLSEMEMSQHNNGGSNSSGGDFTEGRSY